ncbi:MAG: hypothetical protein ACYC2H_11510 [Thermoplasmatota archaeon]
MSRLRPWHVALLGLGAHLAYCAWVFTTYWGSGDALSQVAATLALLLLGLAGSAGIVPTVLLAKEQRIAHWLALGLGAVYLVSVFLMIEGAFLIVAGWWRWRQVAAEAARSHETV